MWSVGCVLAELLLGQVSVYVLQTSSEFWLEFCGKVVKRTAFPSTRIDSLVYAIVVQ